MDHAPQVDAVGIPKQGIPTDASMQFLNSERVVWFGLEEL
jgi:hypothetical protein